MKMEKGKDAQIYTQKYKSETTYWVIWLIFFLETGKMKMPLGEKKKKNQ